MYRARQPCAFATRSGLGDGGWAGRACILAPQVTRFVVARTFKPSSWCRRRQTQPRRRRERVVLAASAGGSQRRRVAATIAGNGAHAVGGEAIVRSCQSCTWAICLGILSRPRRAHTRTVERGETPVERGGYEPILGRSRTTPALRAPRGLRTANLPPQAAGEISRCQPLASTGTWGLGLGAQDRCRSHAF